MGKRARERKRAGEISPAAQLIEEHERRIFEHAARCVTVARRGTPWGMTIDAMLFLLVRPLDRRR